MKIINDIIIPFWNDVNSSLICGFTTPFSGNQALTRKSISSRFTTEKNRENLGKKIKFNSDYFFSPHQIHSDKIIYVDKKLIGSGAYKKMNAVEGDACYTNLNNVVLIVTWADCIPIILFDPENKWVAAIHSGWKSAGNNITGKVIDKLKKNNVNIKKLYAAVGPGIKKCCYKVGNEFKNIFHDYDNKKIFKEVNNDLYFDLSLCVYEQLIKSGVKTENIDYSKICTCCNEDPKLFSFRKDGKKFEAQAAFIGIKNLNIEN